MELPLITSSNRSSKATFPMRTLHLPGRTQLLANQATLQICSSFTLLGTTHSMTMSSLRPSRNQQSAFRPLQRRRDCSPITLRRCTGTTWTPTRHLLTSTETICQNCERSKPISILRTSWAWRVDSNFRLEDLGGCLRTPFPIHGHQFLAPVA